MKLLFIKIPQKQIFLYTKDISSVQIEININFK